MQPPSQGLGEATVNYSYDGEGHRVMKAIVGGPTTVYDAMGQLAAEYNSGTDSSPTCTTCYLSWDHLGSIRIVTDQNGALVSWHDYMPFGEEIVAGWPGARPRACGNRPTM